MSSSSEPMMAPEPHAPFLRPRQGGASPAQPNALAALLGRVTGHRAPSMLVRETAARALEERRVNWGYSRPVVVIDMFWNAVLLVASVVMLIITADERPNTPIRVWVCGYALQCLIHVLLVWSEYRRRRTRWGPRDMEAGEIAHPAESANNNEDEEDDGSGRVYGGSIHSRHDDDSSSFAKRCESINTMLSFMWWITGFYWVVSGGDVLLQNAPGLYWLAVVFLAFDVFFAIFCIVVACLIGIALCCCLPCIIAFLYAVAGTEGASEADISVLQKYRFQALDNDEKNGVRAGKMVPIDCNGVCLATERVLLPEDAECCICLSSYEDGAELHALPCNHHFHSTCIVKWLKMNATCPLCKFNIIRGGIGQA